MFKSLSAERTTFSGLLTQIILLKLTSVFKMYDKKNNLNLETSKVVLQKLFMM